MLLAAIQDGVTSLTWSETFAYAEGWDEQRQRYQGLRAATSVRVVVDDRSVLVLPEVAAAQIEKDRPQPTPLVDPTDDGSRPPVDEGAGLPDRPKPPKPGEPIPPPPPPKLGRFHGSVQLDPIRMGRDAARIAEEVVQHLTGLVGSNVEITVEIQANLPDGAGDKLVRDVTENCRTLKFTNFGFEEV